MAKQPFDLSQLTVAEKLELLAELRRSLYRAPGAFPLSESQRQDLDRRLDELARDAHELEAPAAAPWSPGNPRLRQGGC